jgi:hypothetical protein
MPFQIIRVECVAGYKAEERPVAFAFEGQRREIAEIMDRWYEGGLDSTRPVVNYFKVRTTDNMEFLLRYVPLFDAWSVFTGGDGWGAGGAFFDEEFIHPGSVAKNNPGLRQFRRKVCYKGFRAYSGTKGYLKEDVMATKLMEYFNKMPRIATMSTADKEGRVNAAYFGSPRMAGDKTVVMTLRNSRTFANLQENPHAVIVIMEAGENASDWKGVRVYMKMIDCRTSGEKLETLRTQVKERAGDDAGELVHAAVVFEVYEVRPLVDIGQGWKESIWSGGRVRMYTCRTDWVGAGELKKASCWDTPGIYDWIDNPGPNLLLKKLPKTISISLRESFSDDLKKESPNSNRRR